MKINKALFMIIGLVLVVTSLWPAPVAAESCTCVAYIRAKYGLPYPASNESTAAADYGRVLIRNGYQAVGPKAGAIMIFGRGVLGANRSQGHMAYITSASYNTQTMEWTIQVNHAKWDTGTILAGSGPCNSTGDVRSTAFKVKYFTGLEFYKR